MLLTAFYGALCMQINLMLLERL
uniref:Uncharacterized protein n=1 Tax=Anguilla anguilla TaxID=7936 RepID=A0A0E9R276_ANGAN